MRKFLISAALLTATMAVATPAAAQYGGQDYGRGYGYGHGEFRGGGIQRELAEIRQQIRIGFDRGFLTRGEAERLSRDADHVERRLQRRSWDGLSFREREDLQRRIAELRQRLRFESADRDRRYDRRF
jgi:Spy/CpxP family protein refolding chaperone